MTINHIPKNCNTLNLYLNVDDGKAAVEFYQKAFDGKVSDVMEMPDGSVMHASINIGNSTLMLSQVNPQWGTHSPKMLGGSPVTIHMYVPNADASVKQAIEHGCTEVKPMMDCFWGERMGKVEDPFGFQWGISTQVEVVSPDEMEKRSKDFLSQMSGQ